MLNNKIKESIKTITNIHRPDDRPNVFLFSAPRSGSTWLMELIWSQPGFKHCDEPLNIRKERVQKHLGITDWFELYGPDSVTAFRSYFGAICEGRLKAFDPRPLSRYYRPFTGRIVFKMVNAGENRINWFRDTFNGRILYLVRHPIAVTISSEVFPKLPVFLTSNFSRLLSPEQIRKSRKVLSSGTKLEQGVLSWCIQTSVGLAQATPDWCIVSYEQLVLEPDPAVRCFCHSLNLPNPERILDRLTVPSRVKRKSELQTQEFLERQKAHERSWLVEKWRTRVDEAEGRKAMEILKWFDLDCYVFDQFVPNDRFWVQREAHDVSIPSLVT